MRTSVAVADGQKSHFGMSSLSPKTSRHPRKTAMPIDPMNVARFVRRGTGATLRDAGPVRTVCRMRAVLALLALLLVAPAPATAGAADKRCGSKVLHGETLALWVVGEPIRCEKARRIARGPCTDERPWRCLGLRAPDPILVWLRDEELFEERTTAIEARRPKRSCAARRVTRRDWRRGRDLAGFPTLRQMLADDLLACDQLEGMTRREVRRLLPGVDEHDGAADSWLLGEERQLFRIDAEYLDVTYDRRDVVRRARITQG